jgi:hypothetical protein
MFDCLAPTILPKTIWCPFHRFHVLTPSIFSFRSFFLDFYSISRTRSRKPTLTMSCPSSISTPSYPDPEKAISTHPHSTSPTTYPEGGTRAWLVVLGAWCGLTASIGLYNTTGVLSIVISSSVLTTSSSSSLGWIFSIYAFVVWSVGVWVGPCFDVFGPRLLLLGGTCCTVLGVLCLSFCSGEFFFFFDSFSPKLCLHVLMGKLLIGKRW